MACIYKIQNLINGKIYIGCTIRPLYIRKYEYFKSLRDNTQSAGGLIFNYKKQ